MKRVGDGNGAARGRFEAQNWLSLAFLLLHIIAVGKRFVLKIKPLSFQGYS
jgi:hypothetical protein